jgi:hypothetical protein
MTQAINRVHEELTRWKKMEQDNAALFPASVMKSPEFAELRLKKLDEITAKLSFSSSTQEKQTLGLLAIERKQLTELAYPKGRGLARLLYRFMRPIRAAVVAKTEQRKEQQDLAKLQNRMQQAGFGKYIQKAVEKIREGNREFALPAFLETGLKELVSFKLKFSFDEQKGHSFDQYQASYQHGRRPEDVRHHHFSVSDDLITAQRAANLITGRAAITGQTENGESVKHWTKLDFMDKDPAGNFKMKQFPHRDFDLQKQCEGLPFWKQLGPFEQLRTISGLTLGNRESMTIQHEGKPMRISVEASPEKQLVLGFNEKGKPLDLKKVGTEKAVTVSQGTKQGASQKVKTAKAFKTGKMPPVPGQKPPRTKTKIAR